MKVPNNCLDCKYSSLRLSEDPNCYCDLACTKTDLNIDDIYITENILPPWCPLTREKEE